MKIYKLDIDASKPVRKALEMQKNATGGLKVDVTNNGRTIHNLTTKVYDGDVELPSTDNGFKVDVGSTAKTLKVEATSTPIVCQMGYFVSYGSGSRVQQYWLTACQLSEGVYSQDEFKLVAEEARKNIHFHLPSANFYLSVYASGAQNINITRMMVYLNGYTYLDGRDYVFVNGTDVLPEDEPIVVTGDVDIGGNVSQRRGAVTGTYDYPAVGEYTNCQIEATITPSGNAPCDGDVEWTEELTDSDGEKNETEWKTLTIGGVEYTVLAAASEQPKKVEVKAEQVEEVKEEVKPVVEEVKQVDEEVKSVVEEVKQADEQNAQPEEK